MADFFVSLPATSQAAVIASVVAVIGAILAASLALLGVWITHRGHERRFKKQLQHDRDQKRIEREMELRRKLFLDASDAIEVGVNGVYGLANLAKSDSKLFDEYSQKHAAVTKIHLVAREATVGLIMKFENELDKARMRLAKPRARLTSVQNQIKDQDDLIQRGNKERDRLIDLMKQLNFEGVAPPHHRWEFVNKQFEFEGQVIQKAIEEKNALQVSLSNDWVGFADECLASGNKLREMLPPVVRAVRDELELPFDYAKYLASFDEYAEEQHALQREFLDSLQPQNGLR